MKKYITLAALLAAGSVLANAETINLSATGYTELGGAEENKKVTSYSFDYNGVGAITLKSGWTGFDEDTLGLTGAPDLSGYLTSRGNSEWSYGDSTTSVSFSGLATSFSNDDDSSVSLIKFTTTQTTGSFQLSLVSDNDGGAKLSFAVDGRNTWTSSQSIVLTDDLTTVVVDVELPNITGSNASDVNSDTAANFSILFGGVAIEGLTDVDFNPAVNGDVKQLVLGDAGLMIGIPEPSTFGLLAGLGALALVGTRRRKRA